MGTVIDQGLLDVIGSDPSISRIGERVSAHAAFGTLRVFGEEMSEKPLDAQQRKVLLASLWAFFEQFPTGILALTVRALNRFISGALR